MCCIFIRGPTFITKRKLDWKQENSITMKENWGCKVLIEQIKQQSQEMKEKCFVLSLPQWVNKQPQQMAPVLIHSASSFSPTLTPFCSLQCRTSIMCACPSHSSTATKHNVLLSSPWAKTPNIMHCTQGDRLPQILQTFPKTLSLYWQKSHPRKANYVWLMKMVTVKLTTSDSPLSGELQAVNGLQVFINTI